MKLAVVLGSIREGRLAPGVGKRVIEEGKQYPDIEFKLIDLKKYHLPVMSKRYANYEGTEPEFPRLEALKDELKEVDGYIFVVQEYNNAIPAALKNIFDYFSTVYSNKAAGIVSYGNDGGVVAAQNLRDIFPEVKIAGVRINATFNLFTEFNENDEFIPKKDSIDLLHVLIEEVIEWAEALKSLREKH